MGKHRAEVGRIGHGAEGNTAGSRQKSEVRDQKSEVRGEADL